MANWFQAEVLENYKWTDNLYSLRVHYPHTDFIAGQFVRLALQIGEDRVQRAYSLVNGPGNQQAEIYFTQVADGRLSPALAALSKGDMVDISYPATGFFTLAEVPEGKNLWLVSTGTGIGPFLSMLETEEPWLRFENIILVHGVRWAMDLAYQDKIRHWQTQRGKQLHYLPVVSREQAPHCLHGHLTTHLKDGTLQQLSGQSLDNQSQIMLCGNPAMISDCKAWLLEHGLSKNLRRKPGNITTEQYW